MGVFLSQCKGMVPCSHLPFKDLVTHLNTLVFPYQSDHRKKSLSVIIVVFFSFLFFDYNFLSISSEQGSLHFSHPLPVLVMRFSFCMKYPQQAENQVPQCLHMALISRGVQSWCHRGPTPLGRKLCFADRVL